jgi:hypothetical protein
MDSLPDTTIVDIKKKGCVVIRNVVPDEQALQWKGRLENFVKENPGIEGIKS